VPRGIITSEQLNRILALLNTYLICVEALERRHKADVSKKPEWQILFAGGERNV